MRVVETDFPADPSLFNPLQLQPHYALSIAINCQWRWLRTHLGLSFAELVRDFGASLVIGSFELSYGAPFTCLAADAFTARVEAVELLRTGAFLEMGCRVTADGAEVAQVRITFMALVLEHGLHLAKPGPLPSRLIERFELAERSRRLPRFGLGDAADQVRNQGSLLGSHRSRRRLHRQNCEIADQWCFVEIPRFSAAAREELCFGGNANSGLRRGLSAPLQSVAAELYRPFYLMDEILLETEAFEVDGRLCFLHELSSPAAPDTRHALVVERF